MRDIAHIVVIIPDATTVVIVIPFIKPLLPESAGRFLDAFINPIFSFIMALVFSSDELWAIFLGIMLVGIPAQIVIGRLQMKSLYRFRAGLVADPCGDCRPQECPLV